MKYCAKCGSPLHDEAVICPHCQSPQGMTPFNNNNFYNDNATARPRANKVAMIFVYILMIGAILSCLAPGLIILIGGNNIIDSTLTAEWWETYKQEAIAQDPTMVDFFNQFTLEAFTEMVKIVCAIMGFVYLIPLLWTIPMTISVFKKSKNGTKISTGFKVCVLLFVNLIAGIILLCDNDA